MRVIQLLLAFLNFSMLFFISLAFSQSYTNICGSNEQFIDSLYGSILGRSPDEEGLRNWVSVLNADPKSKPFIIKSFFLSPEYMNRQRSNEDFVRDLYHGVLGREPDPEGFKGWVNSLNNNNSRESVLNGFLESAEFKNKIAQCQHNEGGSGGSSFPLKAKRHDLVPGTNMSMTTEITLAKSGKLTCITQSWTNVLGIGCTGSVQIVIFTSDGSGWISDPLSFGVDGKWIGQSRRTDPWQADVPPDIARNAREVAIIHAHKPKVKDIFDAILRGVERTASEAQRLAEAYARLKKDPNVQQVVQDLVCFQLSGV
ncbi:MAG: DUF4214 domain-containing protein [bacterium]